ncbi:MAG: LapA family protein [Actinomycetota bacterium]|nr:LapA family protein [Actinomycetota bacterium]
MGEDRKERTGSRFLTGRYILAALLIAGLAAFIGQNTESTDVTFLFFEFTAPLWVVLLVTAAVALALGELVGAIIRRRRRDA